MREQVDLPVLLERRDIPSVHVADPNFDEGGDGKVVVRELCRL
jgi:hypothetical protein